MLYDFFSLNVILVNDGRFPGVFRKTADDNYPNILLEIIVLSCPIF